MLMQSAIAGLLSPVFFLLLFSLPSLAKRAATFRSRSRRNRRAWLMVWPRWKSGNPQAAVARATELARVDLVSQLRVTVTGDFSSLQTMKSGTGQESEVRSISNGVRSQVPTVELNEVKVSDTLSMAVLPMCWWSWIATKKPRACSNRSAISS